MAERRVVPRTGIEPDPKCGFVFRTVAVHFLPDQRPTTEMKMAKGEQRGNREAKKPKKDKPKDAIPASPFANQGKSGAPAKPTSAKR